MTKEHKMSLGHKLSSEWCGNGRAYLWKLLRREKKLKK